MRIMIDNDGKATIEPWNKGHLGLTVKQVDGDNYDKFDRFLNTGKLIDDGFGNLYKTIRLCYDYIDPNDKIEYRMWEELRLEYKGIR